MKLTEHLAAELRRAVKSTGSYDPEVSLVVIEEGLTADELDAARAFLGWVHEKGRSFGHNLPKVWAEWRAIVRRLDQPNPEGVIAERENELFERIRKGKRLSADTKLRLRAMVAAVGYAERLRAQGKDPSFELVEKELADELEKL